MQPRGQDLRRARARANENRSVRETNVSDANVGAANDAARRRALLPDVRVPLRGGAPRRHARRPRPAGRERRPRATPRRCARLVGRGEPGTARVRLRGRVRVGAVAARALIGISRGPLRRGGGRRRRPRRGRPRGPRGPLAVPWSSAVARPRGVGCALGVAGAPGARRVDGPRGRRGSRRRRGLGRGSRRRRGLGRGFLRGAGLAATSRRRRGLSEARPPRDDGAISSEDAPRDASHRRGTRARICLAATPRESIPADRSTAAFGLASTTAARLVAALPATAS